MSFLRLTGGMRVAVEPITPEEFEPFGRIISAPPSIGRESFADALDHDQRPAVLSTTHVGPSELPLTIDQLERHPHSSQTFLPLDVSRWIVVVSPGPTAEGLLAFTVGSGLGVSFNRGTWHAGLTALDREAHFAVLMWKDGLTDDEFMSLEETVSVTA